MAPVRVVVVVVVVVGVVRVVGAVCVLCWGVDGGSGGGVIGVVNVAGVVGVVGVGVASARINYSLHFALLLLLTVIDHRPHLMTTRMSILPSSLNTPPS
jgi:hypothetical protein